jgi:hypothetical protein
MASLHYMYTLLQFGMQTIAIISQKGDAGKTTCPFISPPPRRRGKE